MSDDNGSNDVFKAKDGPVGGQKDGWRHAGKMPPKLPENGREWQFQAKTLKIYTIRYDSVYLTCSKKLTGSQL